MRQIVTHARFRFRPQQVWTVMSDLQRYAEWNPLNVSANGKAEAGARVPMEFIDPGRPGRVIRQTVQITAADAPRRLEWVGHIPLLFTGRHFFELAACEAGTDFTHGELLSGLIPAFWTTSRMELQRRAYERFNTALARRLEHVFDAEA